MKSKDYDIAYNNGRYDLATEIISVGFFSNARTKKEMEILLKRILKLVNKDFMQEYKK